MFKHLLTTLTTTTHNIHDTDKTCFILLVSFYYDNEFHQNIYIHFSLHYDANTHLYMKNNIMTSTML